jgi:ankyrin repeat protein
MNAHYDLGVFLIERGANANADGPGWTPLHQIAWTRRPNTGYANPSPVQIGPMGSLEFAGVLIDRGANPNARLTKEPRDGNRNKMNRIGATPFLLAAKATDIEFMRLLAARGADPLTPNGEGTTPLMAAAGVGIFAAGESPGNEAEALAAVKTAFELGGDRVNVNARDANGNTALHGAALRSADSLVQLLVARGATMDVRNIAGWTPLTIANGVFWPNVFNRSLKTAALLRELGATDPGIDLCPQDLTVDCFRMLAAKAKK